MALIPLILTILTALPSLIQAVESIFGAISGNGSIKKQAVLGAAGAIVDAVAAGGDKNAAKHKDAIVTLAGQVTDGLVATYNAVGVFTKIPPLAVDSGSDK